jgi:hypothetical protein
MNHSRIPQVPAPYTEIRCAPPCTAILSGRMVDSTKFAKGNGWTSIPAAGKLFTAAPGRFVGLVGALKQAIAGPLGGLGLQIVPVPEKDIVWLLGEGLAGLELMPPGGARVEDAAPPDAGRLCCGISCIGRAVALQTRGPRSFVSHDEMRASDEASAEREREAALAERSARPEALACRGCNSRSTVVHDRRVLICDDPARVQAALRGLRDHGWLKLPSGEWYCGKQCLIARGGAAVRAAQAFTSSDGLLLAPVASPVPAPPLGFAAPLTHEERQARNKLEAASREARKAERIETTRRLAAEREQRIAAEAPPPQLPPGLEPALASPRGRGRRVSS